MNWRVVKRGDDFGCYIAEPDEGLLRNGDEYVDGPFDSQWEAEEVSDALNEEWEEENGQFGVGA